VISGRRARLRLQEIVVRDVHGDDCRSEPNEPELAPQSASDSLRERLAAVVEDGGMPSGQLLSSLPRL